MSDGNGLGKALKRLADAESDHLSFKEHVKAELKKMSGAIDDLATAVEHSNTIAELNSRALETLLKHFDLIEKEEPNA